MKVGRVARFLAEVIPPYGVNDIEEATGISRGYVCRLQDRLAGEALIRRDPRGPVEAVEWPAMLRQRGQSVDLFRANTTRTYVAPNGARAVFESLPRSPVAGSVVVVTGSFAAVRKAPITAPALLVMYLVPGGRLPNFADIENELGLLPADQAADIALLWPSNDRVAEDPWAADGVQFVNLPQLAVDCLGAADGCPLKAMRYSGGCRRTPTTGSTPRWAPTGSAADECRPLLRRGTTSVARRARRPRRAP